MEKTSELKRSKDLKVKTKRIEDSDRSLIHRFYLLDKEILEKKKIYEDELSCANNDDYLRLTVSRLAYEFAKENYVALYNEIKIRGLNDCTNNEL